MANYCSNYIVFKIMSNGSKAKKDFAVLRKRCEILNNLKEEDVMTSILGMKNWKRELETEWDYCREYFGSGDWQTSYSGPFDITEFYVTMCVDTKWSAPIDFVKMVCSEYKVAGFIEYEEPGCDYCGRYEFVGSEMTLKDELSYNHFLYKYSDSFWDSLYDDMADWVNHYNFDEIMSWYGFATDEDKKRIVDIYNEVKKEYQDE